MDPSTFGFKNDVADPLGIAIAAGAAGHEVAIDIQRNEVVVHIDDTDGLEEFVRVKIVQVNKDTGR